MKLADCLFKHAKLFSKQEQDELLALAKENAELGIDDPEGAAVYEILTEAHRAMKEVTDEIAKPSFRAVGIEGELKDQAVRSELQSMADEAGWAEEGGKLIRDGAGASDEEIRIGQAHMVGNIIGRTKWVPKASWWPDRPVKMREGQVRVAVRKALAGEQLDKPQTRMIEWMIEEAKRNIRYGQMDAEAVYEFTPLEQEAVAALPEAEQQQAIKLADEAQGELDGNWNEKTDDEKEDELDALFGKDTGQAAAGAQGGAEPAANEVEPGTVKLSAEPKQKTREEFAALIAEQKAEQQRRIASIGDVGDMAIMRNEKGDRWDAILGNASGEEGYPYRIQHFDDRGFSGHDVYKTKEEAIKDAAMRGYYIRDDEALHRLQNTPSFQKGNETSDIIRRLNGKQITHEQANAEYDKLEAKYKPLLEAYTKADLAARAVAVEAAEKKKAADEAAAEKLRQGKPKKAEQIDLFNTQGSLFSREGTKPVGGVPEGFKLDEENRGRTQQLEANLTRQTGEDFRVTPLAMRDDAATDAGKASEIASRKMAEAIAGVFGKKIIWMAVDGPMQVNGAIIQGGQYDNYVFLNHSSDKPAHVVLGHELTHHMETGNPAAYAYLQKALGPMLRDNDLYRMAHGWDDSVSAVDITKEMIGDLMGDHFADKKFWKLVAENSEGSAFKQIANAVKSWLNTAASKIKGKLGFGSEQFVTDVNKARVILAQALADYAKGRKTVLNSTVSGDTKLSYVGARGAASSQSLQDDFLVARAMDGKYHNDAIRLATGWFRGEFDGKWRREISDRKVKMKMEMPRKKGTLEAIMDAVKGNSNVLEESPFFGKEHVYNMQSVLDHPLLYKLYPEARNIEFVVRGPGLVSGLQGSFDGNNKITVYTEAKDPKSTLLHEIQHWIQSREGFAAGGNAEVAIDMMSQEQRDKLAARMIERGEKGLSRLHSYIASMDRVVQNGSGEAYANAKLRSSMLWEELQKSGKRLEYGGLDAKTEQYKEWERAYKEFGVAEKKLQDTMTGMPGLRFTEIPTAERMNVVDAQVRLLSNSAEGILNALEENADKMEGVLSNIRDGSIDDLKEAVQKSGESHALYQAIAGEIEARDVQARMDMGLKERAAMLPHALGQGTIQNEDVIVKFDRVPSHDVVSLQDEKEKRERAQDRAERIAEMERDRAVADMFDQRPTQYKVGDRVVYDGKLVKLTEQDGRHSFIGQDMKTGQTVFGMRDNNFSKPQLKAMFSMQPAAGTVGGVLKSNPVSNFINAQVNSPTSLGIFKAFNTQYHKAVTLAKKGLPQFKRVFDKLQEYLNDTNALAIHAEQQGPAIFREPKALKDFFQGAANEKDIKALEPWLNQGTLYGGPSPMDGIVWTDAELRGQQGTRILPRSATPLTDKQIEMYRQARAVIDTSIETGAKALIFRHAKKYGVQADKFDSLDSFVDAVKTQLDDARNDLQIQRQLQQDIADDAFDDFQIAEAESRANPTDRQRRVTMENAKASFDNEQKALSILQDKIEALNTLTGEPGKPGTIDKIRERADKLAEHGYMPLKRFGNRTVSAVDPQGKKRFFGAFDGTPLVPGSANYEMQNVADNIKALHPDWTVTTGVRDEDSWKMFQGLSLDALENFLDFLDNETQAEIARDPVIQEYLINSVNNRSVMKELIHRKGTPGFSKDVARVLATFVTSHARNASGMYHIQDANKLVSEVPKEQGDVVGEAVNLVKYVTQPGEEATKLRGFLFFHFLGASVAAGAVNLMQTPMMTFPTLAKYTGAANVLAKLTGAAKQAVMDPTTIAGDLGAALTRAEREGITAPQQIHHLIATASNNPFSINKAFRGFMNVWGSIFGATEVFNRRVAFIAAHEVGKQNGMSNAEAYDFAKGLVGETQGIYNKGNKPNLARGALGSTVMTFKQFSIMYLELLRRLPPKQQLMMLGVMALAAGGEGLPFAEDIEDVIDTLGQWLGFSTNSGKWIGKAVRDTLGSDFERPLLKGLGGMLPFDLHSRLGMPNLLPGTAFFKPSEIDKTKDVAEAVGPIGSALTMLADSLQMLARGRWDRAALNAAPKAVKDAFNGVGMIASGESQDTRGRLALKDVTVGEGLAKTVGFNPQRASIEGEAKREVMQDKNLRTVRLDDLASDWADAILRKEPDKIKSSIDRVVEWNKDNPDMRIDANTILRAVQERVKAGLQTSEQRFIRSVPRPMKAEAKSELHP